MSNTFIDVRQINQAQLTAFTSGIANQAAIAISGELAAGFVTNSGLSGASGVLQSEIDQINAETGNFYPRSNPTGFINRWGGYWFGDAPQKSIGNVRRIEPLSETRFDQQYYVESSWSFFGYYLNSPMTVSGVSMNHMANANNTGHFLFALYNVDPVTYYPTSKIANSDLVISMSGIGIKTVLYPSSGQPTIPQGLCYGLMTQDVDYTITNPQVLCSSATASMMGQSIFGFSADTANQYWGAGGVGLFIPSYFGHPPTTSPLPSSMTGYWGVMAQKGTHGEGIGFGTPCVVLKGTT